MNAINRFLRWVGSAWTAQVNQAIDSGNVLGFLFWLMGGSVLLTLVLTSPLLLAAYVYPPASDTPCCTCPCEEP